MTKSQKSMRAVEETYSLPTPTFSTEYLCDSPDIPLFLGQENNFFMFIFSDQDGPS